MQEVFILKGLPASGKSTWAKKQIQQYPDKYKRINKDELRNMLDINVWTKKNEKFVEDTRNYIVSSSLVAGKSVIIDDTNIHPKHEKCIRSIVESYSKESGNDVNIVVKEFKTSVEECIKRDSNRGNTVGAACIKKMHSQWLKRNKDLNINSVGYINTQSPEYKWLHNIKANSDLPEAFIFDIDGTLALMDGRNPYDIERSNEDLVNIPMVDVHNALYNKCMTIIIITGRDGKFIDVTKQWLATNGINYHFLYTRPENDMRKDEVVKLELYEKHIKNKYNVIGVFDDRPKVRRMWIDQGIFVFSAYQSKYFVEF